jgi:hypothetical protein
MVLVVLQTTEGGSTHKNGADLHKGDERVNEILAIIFFYWPEV